MSKRTGKQVFESIGSTRSTIQAKLDQIERDIRKTESAISQQNTTRESVLTRLAEIHLTNGIAVSADFRDINGRLQAIFDEKARRRDALNAQIAGLEAEEGVITSKIALSDKQIADADAAVLAAKNAVQKELDGSAEYTALMAKLTPLREQITRGAARLENAEFDVAQKADAFLDDPLFAYLNTRRYGKPDYTGTWCKRGDAWLARITGYPDNRQRYEILMEIPERLEAAQKARTTAFEGYEALRAKLVGQAESKHGVTGAEQALFVARTGKKTRLEQLNANRKAQKALREEKQTIDTGKDEYQKRAKSELKGFFGSQSIAELRAKARTTKGTEDDALVNTLEQAEAEVNTQRKIAKGLIRERGEWESQLSRIKSLESSFSSRDFDGRNARFDSGMDINNLLVGYLAGTMSQQQVLGTCERHHTVYREPEPSYSSYSSSSSSSSYSSSSSSWDSGSSSSYDSGGGFGGGDSSSGGGF